MQTWTERNLILSTCSLEPMGGPCFSIPPWSLLLFSGQLGWRVSSLELIIGQKKFGSIYPVGCQLISKCSFGFAKLTKEPMKCPYFFDLTSFLEVRLEQKLIWWHQNTVVHEDTKSQNQKSLKSNYSVLFLLEFAICISRHTILLIWINVNWL